VECPSGHLIQAFRLVLPRRLAGAYGHRVVSTAADAHPTSEMGHSLKAAEAVRPCTSATPPKADVNSPPWLPPLSAMSGPSALQQTGYLLGGFPNLHNPR
jgi:hypothetical protein